MPHHEHGHSHDHGESPHVFDPARLLEREAERRLIMDPEGVMAEAVTADVDTVVDLGCGVGFFALPGAQRLGRGTFWAIDVHPEMVRTTLERARAAGLSNVEGLVADAHSLPLEPDSVDLVFMGNVLHHFDGDPAVLAEIGRVLKASGRLFLVEWSKVDMEDGPPIEMRFSHDALRAFLESGGFAVDWMKDGPGPLFRTSAHKA